MATISRDDKRLILEWAKKRLERGDDLVLRLGRETDLFLWMAVQNAKKAVKDGYVFKELNELVSKYEQD